MALPEQLPELTGTRVSAPVDEGIGLEIPVRTVEPSWPADWWQRNLDVLRDDPDDEVEPPLSGRQLQVPPAPEPAP